MIKLREYQENGVDGIRQQFANGIRRVAYVLPTGGGKTVVFSNIAQTAAKRGKDN